MELITRCLTPIAPGRPDLVVHRVWRGGRNELIGARDTGNSSSENGIFGLARRNHLRRLYDRKMRFYSIKLLQHVNNVNIGAIIRQK